MFRIIFLAVSLLGYCSISSAEEAVYGEVDLVGLAKNSWSLNSNETELGMVCNVNGPDGYLSIRECPSTNCKINRKLNRLAILEVDATQIKGNWVKVLDAYRNHSKEGTRLSNYKPLPVKGWAHTGYICDFLD